MVKSLIQQGTPLPEGGIEVGITVPVVYLSHGKGEEFKFNLLAQYSDALITVLKQSIAK